MNDSTEPADPRFAGLKRIHRGKVRDTYALPGHPGMRLVHTTDRISIYDFVLSATVADKGAILNAFKHWATVNIVKPTGMLTDLAAAGPDIDLFLPQERRGDAYKHATCVVVEELSMYKVECIVRGNLTGSGLTDYKKDGKVCGHALPEGLIDGAPLEPPLFTPSTKADIGHDVNISAQEVNAKYGTGLQDMSLLLYRTARDAVLPKGVILADTKFEFGTDAQKRVRLGDEYFSPDSSRFWEPGDWRLALREGRTPKSYDKQFMRDWGKPLGINARKPENDDDYAWVRAQRVPEDVLAETTRIYHEIFERLTGLPLVRYQRERMGIAA